MLRNLLILLFLAVGAVTLGEFILRFGVVLLVTITLIALVSPFFKNNTPTN